MSRSELEKSRSRSDAWKNAESKGWNSSPWHTDFAMMCRKTVLRAVLTKGSVPKDMGVGGVITQDDHADLSIESKPMALPKATTQDKLRASLGIDEQPAPFAMVEEAIEAIEACESVEELEALRGRFQDFNGDDTRHVANA